MRTRPAWGNCPLGLLYLLLRGRGAYVVLAPGGNWLVPWHMAAVTRRGHLLHFRRLKPHRENPFGAWWFEGAYEGIGKGRWPAVMARRGRVRTLPAGLALALLLLLYVALFVPWCIAFACYGPLWSGRWAIHAIRKR